MKYTHNEVLVSLLSRTLVMAVTWSTNFKEDFSLDVCLSGSNHDLCVFSIAGSTTSKDVSFLQVGCELNTILRSCATSSIVDIQVNPNGYEECTDPENGSSVGGKGNKKKKLWQGQ
jgi:hypothetical protein